MEIIVRPTAQIAHVNDVRGRVWIGTTADGVEVQLLVTLVAVPAPHDQEAFIRELMEQPAPVPATPAFPLRMVL